MATDLTTECKAGYEQGFTANGFADNPYLFSSDCWLAFIAGQKLAGISGVKSCRKSRGYSVKVISTSGVGAYRVIFAGKRLDDILIIRD